jgi:hypothetical protein
MPSLDDMLKDVEQSLRPSQPGRAAVVASARKELTRLMAPKEDGYDSVEFATILSHRTKQGVVEMTLNREKTQMDVTKAREIHGMLSQAIEAAISDTLIFQFLSQKLGLSEDAAGAALLEFRELRQGSKKSVFPS